MVLNLTDNTISHPFLQYRKPRIAASSFFSFLSTSCQIQRAINWNLISIFGSVYFNTCHLECLVQDYIIPCLHSNRSLLTCSGYQFVVLKISQNALLEILIIIFLWDVSRSFLRKMGRVKCWKVKSMWEMLGERYLISWPENFLETVNVHVTL